VGGVLPRIVLCLGNPGSEYAVTRHNVGWWLAEKLAERYHLGRFQRSGVALVAEGAIDGKAVRVVKPQTFMNRSGDVLRGVGEVAGFDPSEGLLVVVDDVALEPGRARFRPGGSSGGHNGLRSVEAALGSPSYGRLRIGVGAPPPEVPMVDWVLSPPAYEDRKRIMERLDELVEGVAVWTAEGVDAAMSRCNN